jgi:ubiquinone/menaquinone biosynthesis C-methylase UbiE
MVGIGMNASELARNAHLSSYYIKDLNEKPEFKDTEGESVDVVICNVSVDYLTKPIEVFEEMRRVLKTGGTAHMAFSSRCFPRSCFSYENGGVYQTGCFEETGTSDTRTRKSSYYAYTILP